MLTRFVKNRRNGQDATNMAANRQAEEAGGAERVASTSAPKTPGPNGPSAGPERFGSSLGAARSSDVSQQSGTLLETGTILAPQEPWQGLSHGAAISNFSVTIYHVKNFSVPYRMELRAHTLSEIAYRPGLSAQPGTGSAAGRGEGHAHG